MAKLADENGWVLLDDFVRLVKPNSFKNWRGECGGSSGEEGQCSPTEITTNPSEKTPSKSTKGPSELTSTTLAPTIAPGIPALSTEYCNFLCPNSKKNPAQMCENGTLSSKPSDELLENFLSEKIDTIKELLNSLIPLFKSSGKDVSLKLNLFKPDLAWSP